MLNGEYVRLITIYRNFGMILIVSLKWNWNMSWKEHDRRWVDKMLLFYKKSIFVFNNSKTILCNDVYRYVCMYTV